MKVFTIVVLVGAATVAFAALAFTGIQHTTFSASRVASLTSAPPSASPKSPQESPDPAESPEPSDSQDAGGSASAGAHPCNHGFYVSQAAHAHKGGQYVSSIARSDLGKSGDCTAPLPTPAP
jgi:hypothetical protein